MANQDLSKYAVDSSISIKDMKDLGYSASVGQPEGKSYKIAKFTKDGETLLATTAKDFNGSINDNTNIICGANAEGQPRLYLTNKGGMKFTAI